MCSFAAVTSLSALRSTMTTLPPPGDELFPSFQADARTASSDDGNFVLELVGHDFLHWLALGLYLSIGSHEIVSASCQARAGRMSMEGCEGAGVRQWFARGEPVVCGEEDQVWRQVAGTLPCLAIGDTLCGCARVASCRAAFRRPSGQDVEGAAAGRFPERLP